MSIEQQSETTKKPKLNFRFLLSGAWIGGFIFCIIFSIATVFLGEWQMDRRMEKLDEINKIVGNYDIEPVPYSEAGHLFGNFEEQHKWTPVIVDGQYLTEDTLVARNRPRAGVPGFEVLVPFVTESGDRILVDRGWLPIGKDASTPDAIPSPPEGQARIVIRVVPSEETINRDAPAGQVASINLPTVNEQLDYDVAEDAYGLMAGESPQMDVSPNRCRSHNVMKDHICHIRCSGLRSG